jgi:DNA mismatch endonuclease (patch repair protein)
MSKTASSWASTEGVRRSMQANRRRDTGPELALRSELHHRGLRYRVDYRVPATGRNPRPDIAFTRRKIAVFLDGCFWHSCPTHGTTPGGSNAAYWIAKLQRTRERDRLDSEALVSAGWRVMRIWEHEDIAEASDRIEQAVRPTRWLPRSGKGNRPAMVASRATALWQQPTQG